MNGEDIINMIDRAMDTVPDYIRLGRATYGINNVLRIAKKSSGSITQLDLAVELLLRQRGDSNDDGIIGSIDEE